MASEAIARQAVVIGAGIGGLAAARALSDHFEQVVVLERDPLPLGQFTGRVRLSRDIPTDCLSVGSVRSASDFQVLSGTLLKRALYWSERISTLGSSGRAMTRFRNVILV